MNGINTHVLGELCATFLNDLYREMASYHEFDDLEQGSGGNEKLLKFIIEGIMIYPCNPTFIQARDAI